MPLFTVTLSRVILGEKQTLAVSIQQILCLVDLTKNLVG